ncbi:hypothetical protein [Limnobacter sp.]|uniref:hypothetical protein n=1 Tax=Limnobacter sp. TaxID=2003368 RepID=UPI002733FC77|nr:hypothetical protein [Limnobacter sp.]MDP3188506.1 hypothetical protein [Limnobacter sp.]
MIKPFKLYRMNALIACSRNSCIALTALVLTLQVNTGQAESGDVNTKDIQEQKTEDVRPSAMPSPPPSPSATPPQGSGEMMRMPQDEQSTRQKKHKPVAGGVVIRKDATDERGAD